MDKVHEDLSKWFKEKWVNIGKKDKSGKHPKCGTSGDKQAYAKCVPASKARSMSKKDKESATRRKRAAQNKAGRGGKKQHGQGRKPIMVKTKKENIKMKESILHEKLNLFLEKNVPTNPSKWSYYKSQAKKKFDVYPSAYANAWAAKQYKAAGGGWRTKKKESIDESVNEGLSVTAERHFGKKGIIIMIDDNGKKVSAIFKNKKNADKYNRNKSSDLKALLDLAKKTPYPKAIDEATRGEIHKAAKKGNYPATIVVSEKGKVVYQELVKTPQLVPAIFMILQKKYPNAKISVESKSGETLFTEAMDMKKRLKVYDKLKKGDKITIKYGSSMRGGVEKEFVVSKGKTLVGKQKVERIILKNPANPKGVKYYLYQRNGNVTMAIGDMAATIEDMHESVNEAVKPLKASASFSEVIEEAEYKGRKVKLNKPMQGDSKKFKVYVKNEKGNVVVVHFGQKGMNIKKNNPEARKSFRARMNCDNPGPKWKANYWSCRKW